MRLEKLLSKIEYRHLCGQKDVEINSIAYDSRRVEKGALFVCLKGFASDGHRFIPDAVSAGAAAILVEDGEPALKALRENWTGVAVVQVEDAREALAYAAAEWFGHPAQKLCVIGVTGTKGKTTTTHIMKKILEEAGEKVGMIGTIGAYIGEEKFPTRNTTPESYELQQLFCRMVQEGCSYVLMGVSSQALKLKRVAGIRFDYGVFLNISPDHIAPGEHADFEEYFGCKKLLFGQTVHTVANVDDEHWQEAVELAREVTTVSCKGEADYMAGEIRNLWEPGFLGVQFRLGGRLEGEISLNMPGIFNVENALAAVAVTHAVGIGYETIAAGMKKVFVKGRTQLIPEASHFTNIIIDYAHNAISMENLLSMLKSYHPKRLICLFGAGGNRPKQRRYDMGYMAGKYADLTILTTDNPRYEEVEAINRDIIQGLEVYHGAYKLIEDREEAIHYLIDNCGKDDIVALIGKGHEEYQDIKGVKYHFSEEEIILEYLEKK